MSSNVEPFQPGGRAVPEPEPEPDQLTAHDGPARRRPGLRRVLMGLGVVVVVLGSGSAWLTGGRYAATDDAYVQAAKLVVATDVSGLVASVDVAEGQHVRRGELLYQLDLETFRNAVDAAQAALDQTALEIRQSQDDYRVLESQVAAQKAKVDLDQTVHDRAKSLLQEDFASRASYDEARYTLQLDQATLSALQHQAEAQLALLGGSADGPVKDHPRYRQAQAALAEAKRDLDHASVRAPFAGIVTQVDSLQPGDYLVAQTAALTGAGAMALVSDSDMWITAQLKETDLTHVAPGNPVRVTIDAYPGVQWPGTVDSISPSSGSTFSILPAENASGNWVKVVQRVPVRIRVTAPEGAPQLRAGLSANIRIDTGHRRHAADLLGPVAGLLP